MLRAFNRYVKSLIFVSAMFLKVCVNHHVKLSTIVLTKSVFDTFCVCVFVCVIENMFFITHHHFRTALLNLSTKTGTKSVYTAV